MALMTVPGATEKKPMPNTEATTVEARGIFISPLL
jgi:hypothetical protein